MRALKCPSWCKIRKGSMLGRSAGAVAFLIARHVSEGTNVF